MIREFFRYRAMTPGERRRARVIAAGCFALAGALKVVHEVTFGVDGVGLGIAVALFVVASVTLMNAKCAT